MENLTLQEHREQTVGEIKTLLQNNSRVCCVRPTGYGKTHFVIRDIVEWFGHRCLILIPNTALRLSYNDMIEKEKVITYQSLLYKTKEDMKNLVHDVDIIICDECHHLMAKKWGKCVELLNFINKKVKILGLTATPLRADGIDVVKTFFKNIQCKPLNLMNSIDLKFIPKIKYVMGYCDIPKCYVGAYKYELTEVDRYKIDNLLNISNLLKKNMSNTVIKHNTKVVVYISKLDDIFNTVNSCYKWFSLAFPSKFVNIYYLTSNKSQKWNNQQLSRFKENTNSKDIDIIISVNKINEGTHIPNVHTSIFLNRTKSPVKYVQQLGRSLNGDKSAVIFDLVRNANNLQITDNLLQDDNINMSNLMTGRTEPFKFTNYVTVLSFKKDMETILKKYSKNLTYLTDDMKKFIKHHADLTNEQISKILGVPIFTIADYRRTNDLQYNRKHTKPLKDSIEYIKKYANTLGLTYISNELHCTRDSLRKFCSKNNIPYILEDKNNENLEKRNEQIAKMCKEHPDYTDKYIGDKFNLSARHIGDIRRIFDIPNCVQRVRDAQYSEIEEDVIKDYEVNGLSQIELKNKYNVGYQTIKLILSKNKVKSRSNKQFMELRNDLKVKEYLKDKEDIVNSYKEFGAEATRLRYKMSKSIQQQVFIQCGLPVKNDTVSTKKCFQKLNDNKDYILELLNTGVDNIYTQINQNLRIDTYSLYKWLVGNEYIDIVNKLYQSGCVTIYNFIPLKEKHKYESKLEKGD